MRRLVFYILFIACTHPCWSQSNKSLTIGLVIDHNLPELSKFVDNIENETKLLIGNNYQVNFQRYYNGNLVNSPNAVDQLINQAVTDSSVDLIVGVGVVVSGALANLESYEKPVIATSVLDPILQNIPYTEKQSSGVDNFTYVVLPTNFYRDIEVFYEIYPYKNLNLYIDDYLWQQIDNSDPKFEEFMRSKGAIFKVIPVKQDVQLAISELDDEADAVYFGPLISLESSDLDNLIENVNSKKLPSFSFAGRPAVERGVLAGQAPSSNLDRLARRVALNIERYLDDKNLGKLLVNLNYQEALTINMATARLIGFSPGWDFLREGILLNEEASTIERTLNLQTAISEALEANWTLAIADKTVAIGLREIQESRSALLPQLDISATSSIIDKDRAAASGGQFPERSSQGSSSFSQLIYSEGALANFQVAKQLQVAREQNRAATRLDVILETTEAYLNLLITKSVESIQKENIRLNRINLSLAEVRQEVGYDGPSDLYRWQSNIALANIELNNAAANKRTAEINLNRILNRSLDEEFNTVETDILDPDLVTNDARLDQYVNNPEDLKVFTAFMVHEGLDQLPEIKELDANIEAQERLIKFYRRNLFLPDIALAGSADYLLSKGGAGSDDPQSNPGVELPNDFTWQIGLSATLPIFTGGKRSATLQKGLIELEQIQYQKSDLINQLEQRIRSSMQLVGASYSNIQLSNEAKKASLLNFELVQEAYKQGTVSVIDLIDAQNAAIQSQLNAANAGYNFIIDLLNVDRAIGKFYSLSTKEVREAYFIRLKGFSDTYEN